MSQEVVVEDVAPPAALEEVRRPRRGPALALVRVAVRTAARGDGRGTVGVALDSSGPWPMTRLSGAP